jgi:hypothetical protein
LKDIQKREAIEEEKIQESSLLVKRQREESQREASKSQKGQRKLKKNQQILMELAEIGGETIEDSLKRIKLE